MKLAPPLLLILATATPHAAIAQIASHLKTTGTKYYTISPRVAQDILPELNWRSPIRENGVTYHAHTDWSISWSYKVQQIPGGCVVTNIQTRIDIKYTLPKLDERITDNETIARFNPFNEALVKHEHNHGKNGLKAANEIDQALHAIAPQQNCRQLDRYANQVGHSIIQKYIDIDDEYDRSTQNGRTEGAYIQ